MKRETSVCALCGRATTLTFHHLIPKKLHRRKRFRKHYNREQLQAGVHVCRRCHTGLHRLYDEMTLGQRFNTLAALRADAAVQKHCAWVRRQKS